MKTLIRYGSRGVIGWVEGEIFYANRDSKAHFFRNFGGWGISIPVLAILNEKGVKEICLILDCWKQISTELMNFYNYGQKYWDTPEDPQLVLNQCYFSEKDRKIAIEKNSKLTF